MWSTKLKVASPTLWYATRKLETLTINTYRGLSMKALLTLAASTVIGMSASAIAADFNPAVVYDTAGKFDKSFNEAVFRNGAEKFSVDKGVAVREFEPQNEEQREQGLRRLVLLNVPSPIKYLQQKLPNKAKLGLYFNPFGSINDLLNDCILASCQFLVKEQSEIPRDEESFNQCMNYVRAEIADTVLNLAIKVERVLQLSHEINKKLKGNVPLNLIQSHGDVKQHLQKLIYKGFITQAGYQRMADIERYLKAIQRRLEKLPIDPNQDRLKMIEADKVEQQFLQVQAKVKQDLALLAQVNEVAWMIEELKVSLFAQNLKTPYPISVKRITNHIKGFI